MSPSPDVTFKLAPVEVGEIVGNTALASFETQRKAGLLPDFDKRRVPASL